MKIMEKTIQPTLLIVQQSEEIIDAIYVRILYSIETILRAFDIYASKHFLSQAQYPKEVKECGKLYNH